MIIEQEIDATIGFGDPKALRDIAACLAMPAIIAAGKVCDRDEVAMEAYKYADALLDYGYMNPRNHRKPNRAPLE